MEKIIAQSSEELSEDEIHHCGKSHATFDDQRLYKGEKKQQDNEVTKSISVTSKGRKTGPENAPRLMKMKTTNQL